MDVVVVDVGRVVSESEVARLILRVEAVWKALGREGLVFWLIARGSLRGQVNPTRDPGKRNPSSRELDASGKAR